MLHNFYLIELCKVSSGWIRDFKISHSVFSWNWDWGDSGICSLLNVFVCWAQHRLDECGKIEEVGETKLKRQRNENMKNSHEHETEWDDGMKCILKKSSSKAFLILIVSISSSEVKRVEKNWVKWYSAGLNERQGWTRFSSHFQFHSNFFVSCFFNLTDLQKSAKRRMEFFVLQFDYSTRKKNITQKIF